MQNSGLGYLRPEPIPGITAPLPKPAEKPEAPKPQAPTAPAPTLAAGGPSIIGKITLQGTAPTKPGINVKGTPACAAQHPGGMLPDETLIVGKNGEIQDAILFVS